MARSEMRSRQMTQTSGVARSGSFLVTENTAEPAISSGVVNDSVIDSMC